MLTITNERLELW